MDGVMKYNTELYNKNLNKGEKYQEFIKAVFKDKLNINLNFYKTKKEQYNIGETQEGYEVKFDDMFEKTGNIYIEFCEKTNEENKEYIPSGILRNDNTKYYVIGNYKEIYIFKKYKLLNFFVNLNFKNKIYTIKTTATSKGFLLDYTLREKLKYKKLKHERTSIL